MRVPSFFGFSGSQQVFHRKGCSFSGLAESAAFVNKGWLPLVYDDMQSVYVAQIVLFVLNLNFYQPVSGRSGYLDRFLQVHIGSFFFLGWKIKRTEFQVGFFWIYWIVTVYIEQVWFVPVVSRFPLVCVFECGNHRSINNIADIWFFFPAQLNMRARPIMNTPLMVFVLFMNVISEELWWRGYILPRQVKQHGHYTWAIHGVLWAFFHAFKWWAIPFMLFTTWIVPFISQRNENTSTGIIIHFVLNGLGILISG